MVMLVGKVEIRNGDILASGAVLDFMAKKIYRVCKSSLAAECVGISNGADIGLWTRVLGVELFTGVFLREMVDCNNSYSATSPFGFSPGLSDIKHEMQPLINWPCHPGGVSSPVITKLPPTDACQEKTLRDKLFAFGQEQVGVMKLLMLTGSANAYSSLVTGFPRTAEKSLRIILPYTRNLLTVMCISFIDKDYNLADCGTKSETRILSLWKKVLQFNIPKIGFMGRSWVQDKRTQAREQKKKPHPCKNSNSKWIFIYITFHIHEWRRRNLVKNIIWNNFGTMLI